MNFYKRFIGDYAKKTAHLSLMEHGAYTLMLDALYATEKGLPSGYQDLFRICRAMSKPEQVAVTKVADEFFPVGEDGLRHNGRATAVMEEAAPAVTAARENGKKGGRPKKTQEKPTGFADGTQDEPGAKASQSQSQSQNSPSLRSGERATSLPENWTLPEEWAEWARAERPDLDPHKVAAKFADYWRAKGGKDGRKKDWLATWRNWVRDERAPKQAYQPEERQWFDSRSGVERKAAELGIKPWNEMEEHWPQYRQRVMKAVKGESGPALSLDQLAAMAQQRMAA